MGKRGREVAERGREVGRKRRGWHHEAKESVLRKEWGNTVKVVPEPNKMEGGSIHSEKNSFVETPGVGTRLRWVADSTAGR